MQQGNLDQKDALKFILAGNALFTIASVKTKKRFTYKIFKDRNIEDEFKVYSFIGNDNTNMSHYRKIGIIKKSEAQIKPLSEHSKTLDSFIAIDAVYLNLCIDFFMPSLEIWHEGRCCKCGRVLTVPESIAMGVGPECAFSL